MTTLALRLQCVLQPLCACLSSDGGPLAASQCVLLLTSVCGHRDLAQQLSSQHGETPRLISHVVSTALNQQVWFFCFKQPLSLLPQSPVFFSSCSASPEPEPTASQPKDTGSSWTCRWRSCRNCRFEFLLYN